LELFDTTIVGLERAMSGSALRQQVIANNIANANTAGFKRSDLDFASTLASALDDGSSKQQIDSVDFSPVADPSSGRADGNNVDIDREANNLAQTQLHFSALMAVVTKNLSTMSQIITSAR
jgi:flagellar basal-body rod protein FlgB